jgi:hypothetical protein
MKCDDAAEFVSALCDGETIPREAAKHIGECPSCRTRLAEYAEMAAELRRLSSLQSLEEEKIPRWQKIQRVKPNWWRKGWNTMKIPRLAFASMLLAIIVLAFSLTIVKVRAHSQGIVLMLTAKTASGRTVHCAVPMEDRTPSPCVTVEMVNRIPEMYGFRIISTDGDRIELGVRAKAGPDVPSSTAGLNQLPETPYWFEPGEKLHVDVQGGGPMLISGELLDHMPPYLAIMGGQLDPDPGELRFVDPVLLRGKKVLYDFEGITVSGAGKDEGVELCAPQNDRYEISLSRLRDAAEGTVQGSRISFTLNGQPHEFLTGAPVTRANRVWILYLPNDKSTKVGNNDRCGSGYAPMKQYLASTPPN